MRGGYFMRSSRAEMKIEEILKEANLNFQMEYSFAGLNSPNGRPLRFDFVIFDDDGNIDFIIEYQGKQHYEASLMIIKSVVFALYMI